MHVGQSLGVVSVEKYKKRVFFCSSVKIFIAEYICVFNDTQIAQKRMHLSMNQLHKQMERRVGSVAVMHFCACLLNHILCYSFSVPVEFLLEY